MKNKFLKNTTWLIMGQIVQMVMQLIVGMLSARFLGPSNYGIINYVASYVTFFTSFCELGMNGVIINELVTNKDNEGKLVSTCILMRFFVSIISMVSVCALVFIVDGGDKTIFYIAVLESIQIPFAAFDTINYWFQSKLESKYVAIIRNVAYFCTAAYKIYLLATGKSVYWFAAATTLDVALLGIMYLAIYEKRRDKNYSKGWSNEIASRMLKGCGPFILANIMVQIYQQTDKIMIKQMLPNSTEEVGLYTAVTTICVLFGFIPTAILDSARPVVMKLKKTEPQKYQLRIRQLFASLIWVDALYAFGITIFSRFVIFILYGSQYLSASNCLKICVWYTAFSYLGSARSTWLICEGKNKFVFIFSSLGAIANVILNLILIPSMGINGAALATLVAQFLANIGIPYFLKETRTYCFAVADALLLRNIQIREAFMSIKRVVYEWKNRSKK